MSMGEMSGEVKVDMDVRRCIGTDCDRPAQGGPRGDPHVEFAEACCMRCYHGSRLPHSVACKARVVLVAADKLTEPGNAANNAAAKLERFVDTMQFRGHIPESLPAAVNAIEAEIGDTIVYLDLLAQLLGLNTGMAVINTFSRISGREAFSEPITVRSAREMHEIHEMAVKVWRDRDLWVGSNPVTAEALQRLLMLTKLHPYLPGYGYRG